MQINGRLAALLELGSGFNPEFTGLENVYLNGSILGMSREEMDARLDDILAFADIGDFIDQPVKTYSSGMYVRLAFAIQANIDPEILIVDEALAVGDAYFVHKCMLRFNELQAEGRTILFVSHDANAVRNLCGRAIWLENGVIKETDAAGKVVDDYLARLFGQAAVTNKDTAEVSLDHSLSTLSSGLAPETSIPNIDRRLGDQKCEILGAGLYDESLKLIGSTLNNCTVIVRLTMRNNSVDHDCRLVAGYIFRNSKGQEIASTNSLIEDVDIGAVPLGGCVTMRMYITLPILHPGSYAFSLAAGYVARAGEIVLSDRVENALVFEVMTNKKVHVMMNFKTDFKRED
jgi:lipopolysaccharide transport system ATP-binding protein